MLEVPQIRSYNYIMEIKDKKGSWVKIEKGDVIGDGFKRVWLLILEWMVEICGLV